MDRLKSDLFVAILATATHTADTFNFLRSRQQRWLKDDAQIALIGTKLELSNLMSRLSLHDQNLVKESDWHLVQLNAGKLDFPMWGLIFHRNRKLRDKPVAFNKKATFQECVERLIKLCDTKGEFRVLSFMDKEHLFIRDICIKNFFFFGGI